MAISLRAISPVATWFNTTGGPVLATQAGDTNILFTGEYIGSNVLAALGGSWVDISPDATKQIRAFMSVGAQPMPANINWGNQFQWALCASYLNLSTAVDVSSFRATSSAFNFNFPSATVPSDNELVIACGVRMKTSASDAAAINTYGSMTIQAHSWPAGSRPGVVYNDWIQTTKTNLGLGGNATTVGDASPQSTQGIILVIQPASITASPLILPPGDY